MTAPHYADDTVTLLHGDCLELLTELDDASIDAICTDPPYGLEFMGQVWDAPWKDNRTDKRGVIDPASWGGQQDAPGAGNPYSRARIRTGAAHYGGDPAAVGRQFQTWCEEWAAECLRVLKPGGHFVCFGGARTWHRLAAAVEDVGFEVRDSIAWLYGSGFPKSLDVSKAIDKAAGAEREIVGRKTGGAATPTRDIRGGALIDNRPNTFDASAITAPATPAAEAWQGWGTALKPAFEPIVVARKPLAGTVVGNVLAHGTGALNIDGCRVGSGGQLKWDTPRGMGSENSFADDAWTQAQGRPYAEATASPVGRWPTNVVLGHAEGCVPIGPRLVRSDGHHPAARGRGGVSTAGHAGQEDLEESGSGGEVVEAWSCALGCPVRELDEQTGVLRSGANPTRRSSDNLRDAYGEFRGQEECTPARGKDVGGASRFFPVFRYEAKAPAAERPRDGDVAHPTVKPLDLMRWLVRLVTPPGGVVLDPFAGSGTTGEAAIAEGFRAVLIEREAAYLPLILSRLTKPIQVGLFGEDLR